MFFLEGAVTLGLVGGAIVPKNYVYPGIFLGLTLGIWLYSGFFYQLLGKMKEKGRYLALPGELLWKPLLAALTVVLSEMAVGPWLALPLALLATNSWGFILAHNQKRPALGAVLTIYGSIMVLWFGIDIAPILFLPNSGLYWAGMVLGLFLLALAVLALVFPHWHLALGLIILVLSVLSYVGAAGGVLLGGCLILAWAGNKYKEKTINLAQ